MLIINTLNSLIYFVMFEFIFCRTLSRQNRVRVHINFFMALIVQEVVSGLWDVFITYDKIKSSEVFQTALMKNGVGIFQCFEIMV